MKSFVDVIIKHPEDGAIADQAFRRHRGASSPDTTGAAGRERRRSFTVSVVSGPAPPQSRLDENQMILRDGVASGSAGNIGDGARKRKGFRTFGVDELRMAPEDVRVHPAD